MKTIQRILLVSWSLMLLSCGGGNQQVDIFPLVCYNGMKYNKDAKEYTEDYYYGDAQGEVVIDYRGKVDAIDGKKVWSVGPFSDGLAKIITQGSNCYFIDKQGQIVLNIGELFGDHYSCSDFSEGIAFIKAPQGSFYSAINKKGEHLFDLDGEPFTPFVDGLALFRNMEHNYEIGIVNKKGEIILEPKHYKGFSFDLRHGKLCVKQEGEKLYGAINLKGNIVINSISEEPFYFDDNNCAIVVCDNKYGLIDEDGEFLIEPQYDYLVNDGKWYQFTTEDNKAGWCDKKGKVMIEPFVDGDKKTPKLFYGDKWAWVRIDGKSVFINKKGEIVLEPEYEINSPFIKDVAITRIPVERQYTHVFMDREGNLINSKNFSLYDKYIRKLGNMLMGDKSASWSLREY